MDCDYVAKVVIVGDANVGKTSLLCRFMDNEFTENVPTTIGVDTKIKTMHLEQYDKTIKMQCWDTAGQERFQNVSRLYLRGAVGAILVFSIDDRSSFEHLDRWIDTLCDQSGIEHVLLVGNKADLDHKRKVPHKECHEYAEKHNLQYVEASAKTNDCVQEAFFVMAEQLVLYYEQNTVYALARRERQDHPVVTLGGDQEAEQAKRACC